jgi:hypothetical protein
MVDIDFVVLYKRELMSVSPAFFFMASLIRQPADTSTSGSLLGK